MSGVQSLLLSCQDLIARGGLAEAESRLRGLVADPDLDERAHARALDLLGKCLSAAEEKGEALKAFASSAGLIEKLWQEGRAGSGALINSLWNLARANLLSGKPVEAESIAKKALQISIDAGGENSPLHAASLFHLSAPAYHRKDYEAAAARLRGAIKIWEACGGHEESVASCLNNLGRIYEELGDFARGAEYHSEAVERRRRLPNREDLAFSLGNYGLALAALGDIEEALAALRECLSVYQEAGAGESREAQAFRGNFERLSEAAGR